MKFQEIEKFTMYVGLNDKDTHNQKIKTPKAKQIVARILQDNGIAGATFLSGNGIYKDEQEKTFKIEVLFAKDEQIKKVVDKIKKVLNQEAVEVTKEIIKSAML